MQTAVTRKYQVTIPKPVREKLGIRIGDRLIVKEEHGKVLLEPPRRVANPVEHLWSLSSKPIDIDVVRLVEDSWRRAYPVETKRAMEVAKRAKRG